MRRAKKHFRQPGYFEAAVAAARLENCLLAICKIVRLQRAPVYPGSPGGCAMADNHHGVPRIARSKDVLAVSKIVSLQSYIPRGGL